MRGFTMSTRLPILAANGPVSVLRTPERYAVAYPSGHRFVVSGTLVVLRLPTGYAAPVILTPDERVLTLDPRGAVSRNGTLLYDPRQYLDDLDPTLATWLDDHPAWPAELELDR